MRNAGNSRKIQGAVVISILKFILRHRIRGATRLTCFLARHLKSLQLYPVEMFGAKVYIDLRITSSHHILIGTNIEAAEMEVARKFIKPGDTVWDIGAHFGAWTAFLSRLVDVGGMVYAFEPNPLLLRPYARTTHLLGNVWANRTAISNTGGYSYFMVPADYTMARLFSGERLENNSNEKLLRVTTTTIDSFLFAGLQRPPPAFIKCDVEGAESLVFEGGRKLLGGDKAPTILFEYHPIGFGKENPVDKLREINPRYKFHKILPGGVTREIGNSPTGYCNILAVAG